MYGNAGLALYLVFVGITGLFLPWFVLNREMSRGNVMWLLVWGGSIGSMFAAANIAYLTSYLSAATDFPSLLNVSPTALMFSMSSGFALVIAASIGLTLCAAQITLGIGTTCIEATLRGFVEFKWRIEERLEARKHPVWLNRGLAYQNSNWRAPQKDNDITYI